MLYITRLTDNVRPSRPTRSPEIASDEDSAAGEACPRAIVGNVPLVVTRYRLGQTAASD
ncbi:hypothetical protein Pla52n_35510 [Stieleria varia]|uniref:Uncharacterized protein n=1 Tax=Stieleria varia TaxID=2528005 RepID=A0A5C6ASQ0_9BACT|nr:hypothetical protein Pla52n_35510 [Stieleria varia]